MTTRILLTGATGSFGKAFIAHCMQTPQNVEIYALSRDECKQAALRKRWADYPVSWILGDVRHPPALPHVDLVVHAAAMKHVGRGEEQPQEFVATNILGSANIIDHAVACDCPFVVLSTDKACQPINAYGATKLVMEKMALASRGAVVRYGNVLGSRGSLIPFILQCIRTNQPIPITDPRMTRFWIHLHEAVQLVLDAWQAQLMDGLSAVHIPMAPAMAVTDLVAALAPGHPTYHCGIMPGEKLHEVMVAPDESFRCYDWSNRFILADCAPPGACAVSERFSYTSATAPLLTAETLREKLKTMDLVDNELVIREGSCGLQ